MEKQNSFVLHGNIIYTPDKDNFVSLKNGYMVVEDGKRLLRRKNRPQLTNCP